MRTLPIWIGLTITGVVMAAVAVSARLAPNGWIKSVLRWTLFALPFVVVWNLAAVFFFRRGG